MAGDELVAAANPFNNMSDGGSLKKRLGAIVPIEQRPYFIPKDPIAVAKFKRILPSDLYGLKQRVFKHPSDFLPIVS